jgi:hypothetical protein
MQARLYNMDFWLCTVVGRNLTLFPRKVRVSSHWLLLRTPSHGIVTREFRSVEHIPHQLLGRSKTIAAGSRPEV